MARARLGSQYGGIPCRRFLKDIQPDMLELNDRLLVTSPRTAARRGAIAAARRGQEQVRWRTSRQSEPLQGFWICPGLPWFT